MIKIQNYLKCKFIRIKYIKCNDDKRGYKYEIYMEKDFNKDIIYFNSKLYRFKK
jgi:hypothetical protein